MSNSLSTSKRYVSMDDFNAKIDELKNKGIIIKQVKKFNYKTRRQDYYHYAYIYKDGDKFDITYYEPNKKRKTITYSSSGYTESEEQEQLSGRESFNELNERFCFYIGNHYGLMQLCGYREDNRELRDAIKKCVPKQIQWMDGRYKGKIVDGCCKADVSSAFPYQLLQDLPTLEDAQRIDGVVPPTEDYPFAFYPECGQMRILYEQTFDNLQIFGYTILCKKVNNKVQKALKETITELYNGRNDNPQNKNIMNATIGYCHYNKNPFLPQIAATVIYRNNNRMRAYEFLLKTRECRVLYIATDSIVWKGNAQPDIAKDVKEFGAFVNEGTDGKFFGWQIGSYQFQVADKIITKCSYLKNSSNKQNLKLGELPLPKAQQRAVYQDEQGYLREV